MILPAIASFILFQAFEAVTSGASAIGDASGIEKQPWLVSIRYKNNRICTGSIVFRDAVLTAAQCANYPRDDLTVQICHPKADKSVTYQVIDVRIHGNYQELGNNTINDVALIRVSSEFPFSKEVRRIALPYKRSVVGLNTVVSVAGWIKSADHSAGMLTSGNLRVVDTAKCNRVRNVTNTEGQICLGITDKYICHGDFGGPVMINNVQIGIVPSRLGCASNEKPKLYTNVVGYSDWLDEHLTSFYPAVSQVSMFVYSPMTSIFPK